MDASVFFVSHFHFYATVMRPRCRHKTAAHRTIVAYSSVIINTRIMTEKNKNEQLLEIIRRQVKLARFSRRVHDAEEIVNEVFLRLSENPVQTEDRLRLESHINVTIRRILRKERTLLERVCDIDEIEHDEHPSYTMEEFRREESFSGAFKEFCRSRPTPKSEVYSLSMTHSKEDIARILGVSVKKVRSMIVKMPGEFKIFLGEK